MDSTWRVWVHSLKVRLMLGAADTVAAKMVDVGLRPNAAATAKTYWAWIDAS